MFSDLIFRSLSCDEAGGIKILECPKVHIVMKLYIAGDIKILAMSQSCDEAI